MKLERRREGRLTCVTGASRSGKSVWTAQQVRSSSRLLVWDLLGEWSSQYRCRRVSSLRELAAAIATRSPGRLAYHSPDMLELEQFEPFCRIAWCWVRLGAGALVIEETASVTSPGKAPPAWGSIVRMGLRYGVDLYALTQRPAESDKTAFGNATVIHAGRCAFPRDRAAVAEYLDVPLERVAALKPLEWLERDATGVTRAGRVNLRGKT